MEMPAKLNVARKTTNMYCGAEKPTSLATREEGYIQKKLIR